VMECPHCGAANKPESRYCGECGQPLGTPKAFTCPLCDTTNAPGILICTECGADLIPPGVSLSEIPLEPVGGGEGDALMEEPPGEGQYREEAAAEVREAADEDFALDESGKQEEPPWLKKLDGIGTEESPEPSEEEAHVERGGLPEWLEVPLDFEEMLSQAPDAAEEGGVEPGDLPAWLEPLRPERVEETEEPAEVAGPGEVTGLLKGIRGTLGIEPMLAIPRRASPTPAVAADSVAFERAELFSEVVREPLRPGLELAPPRRAERLAASSVRWITYLIVAAAVVVPLLLGSNWSVANMPSTPAAAAMYGAIEGLPAGSVALVSHDYDPGVAGEMIPQARAVLGHLMGRGVRVVNVSLTPEGSRLSEQLLGELAEEHQYVYGQDYLSLGYVVGVEAGPRAVVEGLVAAHWSSLIEEVADISLVVEFAGAPEYLRLWLEQVQAPYGLPMVAGVSATADPYARPYYRNEAQDQLLGLITGFVGAAEYERLSGQEGVALAGMDAQSLAHLAIILLVVVGNVAYFAQRMRGRLSR